jgi:hypothetical protein
MKVLFSTLLLCLLLRLPLLSDITTYKQQLNHWITTLTTTPIKIKLSNNRHSRYLVLINIPPLFELLSYQLVSLLLIGKIRLYVKGNIYHRLFRICHPFI